MTPIGRDFSFSMQDIEGSFVPLLPIDMHSDAVRMFNERLAAETERWIWKAIAQGVGNRVWRSNAVSEEWPSTVVRHRFAILKPGELAPGAGIVFGPFSHRH